MVIHSRRRAIPQPKVEEQPKEAVEPVQEEIILEQEEPVEQVIEQEEIQKEPDDIEDIFANYRKRKKNH